MDQEVIIVGGGLVGLVAALALSAQGRKLALLESRAIDFEAIQNDQPLALDARSIALSYSSIQIFRSLGLWDELQKYSAPIRQIHVSTKGHFGVTRLQAETLGLPFMGQVVEYHALMRVLLVAARQDARIQTLSPATVSGIEQMAQSVRIDVDLEGQNQQMESALIVIADGANSSLAESLGIVTKQHDYAQSAIVANVSVNQAELGCAYERFTPSGPMAMLPLQGRRYAMVWTSPPQKVDALMAMSDAAFIEKIYDQFGKRLGWFEQLGRRDVFDLKMRRASPLVKGRCVLIGNAANTLHPVAGQGFNLGMRDIALLFDLLTDQELADIDFEPLAQGYQSLRLQDHEQTVMLGNGLVHLFSNDWPVLNHARGAALAMMDLCPALKQAMSWQGMGYGDACSSLMRGCRLDHQAMGSE